jgi:ATP-dependent Clp protease ATP-binding subunit ClpC
VFERFTDRSRRVLVLAQEEARLLGHGHFGTEHLLLGLLREGEGVAAKALDALEIDLHAIRDKVEEVAGQGTSSATGSTPFTPRARKALELSMREAKHLGHDYIGTEHLLLGLVREGEGLGAQVLILLGADLARVRREVMAIVSGRDPSQPDEIGDLSPWPRARGSRADETRPEAESALYGGPRCPSCRALLEGRVVYRVLSVPPGDESPPGRSIDVIFVYCLTCGSVVAHAPDDPSTVDDAVTGADGDAGPAGLP